MFKQDDLSCTHARKSIYGERGVMMTCNDGHESFQDTRPIYIRVAQELKFSARSDCACEADPSSHFCSHKIKICAIQNQVHTSYTACNPSLQYRNNGLVPRRNRRIQGPKSQLRRQRRKGRRLCQPHQLSQPSQDRDGSKVEGNSH